MKILLIHNYYKCFGGEDKVVQNEEQLLRRNGQKVITFYKHNSEIDSYDFFNKVLFFPHIFYNKRYLKELRKLVKLHKPDVAHVHNIYPLISVSVYEVLNKLEIPIIQTFHDHRLALVCPQGNAFNHDHPCELCHNGGYLHCIRNRCVKNNFLLSLAYTLAVLYCQKLGIINRYVKKGIYFNSYMKSKLIHIGIKESILVQKPHFLQENISEPTYASQDYAVYLGAVSMHKGIGTLLNAFESMNEKVGLKIIGAGDAVSFVTDKINQRKGMEYMGEIKGEARFKLLLNAFCLIIPTECFETFGLTIMESFACGVPVIGSSIGGIPYIIDHEKNGLLFETGNSADLKAKITFLFNNRDIARNYGRNARMKYLSDYTPERNYKLLMDIYTSAMSGPVSSTPGDGK